MSADTSSADPKQTATEELIAAFSGIRPMAKKLDIPVTTVQGWKKRQAIPTNRHEEIAEGAKKHGITLRDGLLAETAPDETGSKPDSTAPKADTIKAESATTMPAADNETTASEPPATGKDEALTREQADEASPTATDKARQVKNHIAEQRGEKPKEPADGSGSPKAPEEVKATTPLADAAVDTTTPHHKSSGGAGGIAVAVAVLSLAAVLTAPYWQYPLYGSLGLPLPADPNAERLENLSSRLEELRDDFRVVSQRPQGISQQRFTAALQQIDTRLEELESSIAYGLAENNGGGVSPQAFERLRRDIGRDLAPIAETVDELESALVALQSEQRNAMPARAASFVLASGNLVTAARSSKPFGTEMNAVQALAPTGPEAKDILNRLAQYAERGAPTASELAAQLGHQAGDALAAIRMNEEQSTLEQTIGRLQSLITVRQAPGEVEGDTPPALLARAEYRLQNGDVEAAYALTDRLPEPAIEALADWREQALRRISVDEALSQLIALSASTAEAEQ